MSLTIIWVLISLMSLAVGILIGVILYEHNRKMRSIGILNVIDTSEGIQMALALDSEVKEFVNM